MGSNDRVQGVISQLEDTCKTIEVSQLARRDAEPILTLLGARGWLSDTLKVPSQRSILSLENGLLPGVSLKHLLALQRTHLTV